MNRDWNDPEYRDAKDAEAERSKEINAGVEWPAMVEFSKAEQMLARLIIRHGVQGVRDSLTPNLIALFGFTNWQHVSNMLRNVNNRLEREKKNNARWLQGRRGYND